jgi:hypothetical protein
MSTGTKENMRKVEENGSGIEGCVLSLVLEWIEGTAEGRTGSVCWSVGGQLYSRRRWRTAGQASPDQAAPSAAGFSCEATGSDADHAILKGKGLKIYNCGTHETAENPRTPVPN